MSGLPTDKIMTIERVKEFFQRRDRLAASLDIELVDASLGSATVKMQVADQHLNGVNVVHGGAIFTLADFAFAVASNSYGTVAVAINVSITFMKAATAGTLTARAREVSRNAKLSSYTIDITDEQGDLIAVFQGLAYRKKDNLLDVPQD